MGNGRRASGVRVSFAAMVREQADAVFVTGTALNYAHLRRIADLGMTHRMPSFFEAREFANSAACSVTAGAPPRSAAMALLTSGRFSMARSQLNCPGVSPRSWNW